MTRPDLADALAAALATAYTDAENTTAHVVATTPGAIATGIAAGELVRGLVRLGTNAREPRDVANDIPAYEMLSHLAVVRRALGIFDSAIVAATAPPAPEPEPVGDPA